MEAHVLDPASLLFSTCELNRENFQGVPNVSLLSFDPHLPPWDDDSTLQSVYLPFNRLPPHHAQV